MGGQALQGRYPATHDQVCALVPVAELDKKIGGMDSGRMSGTRWMLLAPEPSVTATDPAPDCTVRSTTGLQVDVVIYRTSSGSFTA